METDNRPRSWRRAGEPAAGFETVTVPAACVMPDPDRPGEWTLRPEVLCPVPGWRMPAYLCGPDAVAQLGMGDPPRAGDAVHSRGWSVAAVSPRKTLRANLCGKVGCWRVVEPRAEVAETVLEFECWGELKG